MNDLISVVLQRQVIRHLPDILHQRFGLSKYMVVEALQQEGLRHSSQFKIYPESVVDMAVADRLGTQPAVYGKKLSGNRLICHGLVEYTAGPAGNHGVAFREINPQNPAFMLDIETRCAIFPALNLIQA